jgi:GMP synthase (glutamine-hydrolysing)
MGVTVLLLQARNDDDAMREHEHACFVERTGLPPGSITCHNLCAGPPTLARVRAHATLMVGGSGDYYVSKGNLPDFERLLDLLREVVAVGHPTFASCFGYQLMVRALGGEIVHDPARTEVGSYTLRLTDAGRADELFRVLPASFCAQMGHKDRATAHPPGIPNLASSVLSPLQALRIPGKPIWASQFHPELDRATNEDRFRHYLKGYAPHLSKADRDEALASFRESPEASSLLTRFVRTVLA